MSDEELAAKIADLLIDESSVPAKTSVFGKKQKTKSPFVKKALPGDNQVKDLSSQKAYLKFVQLSSLFYIAFHLYLFGSVYELWGGGKPSLIILSLI